MDIEEALDRIHGPRESYRESLANKDVLLAKVCRYAEIQAERQGVEPWSIIGEIMGHGSGVSSAIYQLYREASDDWCTSRPPSSEHANAHANSCVEVTYDNGMLGWEPIWELKDWKQGEDSTVVVAWRPIRPCYEQKSADWSTKQIKESIAIEWAKP